MSVPGLEDPLDASQDSLSFLPVSRWYSALLCIYLTAQ